VGGIILGILPVFHMLIPEVLMGPGFFAVNYGFFDFVAFLAMHVIYGAIVGGAHEQMVAGASRTVPGTGDRLKAA
jgi:hypothetical protein